jgi:hypothetical protein
MWQLRRTARATGAQPACASSTNTTSLQLAPALSHPPPFYTLPPSFPSQIVKAYVADEARDPGYWGTSRMVLEAGLCLALDAKDCDAAGCKSSGVLTPASAMGLVLMDRLRAAGLK